jgi:hypothetical protein
MAAAATQQLMANSMMQQQLREGMKTRCLLKLMQFGERLSGFPVRLFPKCSKQTLIADTQLFRERRAKTTCHIGIDL